MCSTKKDLNISFQNCGKCVGLVATSVTRAPVVARRRHKPDVTSPFKMVTTDFAVFVE